MVEIMKRILSSQVSNSSVLPTSIESTHHSVAPNATPAMAERRVESDQLTLIVVSGWNRTVALSMTITTQEVKVNASADRSRERVASRGKSRELNVSQGTYTEPVNIDKQRRVTTTGGGG
jgi:hypothetical protein